MSSFVRFNTPTGEVRVNWTGPWPPPERLWTTPSVDGDRSPEVWNVPRRGATEYVQVSASVLTADHLAAQAHLQRGALYAPVVLDSTP